MMSAEVHRLRPGRPPGPVDDLLKAAFGGLQLLLAVGLECLPALVKGDGILKIDLALLQPADDGFKLAQRRLETQGFDRGLLGFGLSGHSELHQRPHMRRSGSGERGEVIPAFESRNNATLTRFGRIGAKRPGGPAEVLLRKGEIRQRVAQMGVESRRDEKEIGTELFQRRKRARFERHTQFAPARARRQWKIDDVAVRAALLAASRSRIKGHLMRGYIKRIRIVPENVLRAIAVVHVEIDDGDAMESSCPRVIGAHGDVIEQAKAHCSTALRMMTGRTYR